MPETAFAQLQVALSEALIPLTTTWDWSDEPVFLAAITTEVFEGIVPDKSMVPEIVPEVEVEEAFTPEEVLFCKTVSDPVIAFKEGLGEGLGDEVDCEVVDEGTREAGIAEVVATSWAEGLGGSLLSETSFSPKGLNPVILEPKISRVPHVSPVPRV